ncbi:hypothetical protein GCM10010980_25680 [Corynebacterium marinum]|nr:hypothetical protein GCM10010980_25680 [Corynebacterium marinum]
MPAAEINRSPKDHRRIQAKSMKHLGSAHTDEDLALLKAQARRLVDGDQMSLALGVDTTPSGSGSVDAPVPITSERAGHLLDVIHHAYTELGLDTATGGDQVFRDLLIARIVQPGSTFDSIETLAELGVASASYPTINRRLPAYATGGFRDALTRACATHAGIGPGVLVLFDVTTLYFETDEGDDFRKPGFSKERRLEPQITVGLLSDAHGFPLAVGAFEGNMAETRTMLPMIRNFQDAYGVEDVTVVADAGMFSAGNKAAIIEAGLHYILGVKFKDIPYPVAQWRKHHPGQDYEDKQIWTYADRTGRGPDGVPHSVTYYQYSWDRARRTLKGIDEQVAKAEKAVAGKLPVKRNRFVDLKAPNKQVNWTLVDKNKALAGIKGVRDLPGGPARGTGHPRLPAAAQDREGFPDVEVRSQGPADLPPQTRIHRGTPERGDGRDGCGPSAGGTLGVVVEAAGADVEEVPDLPGAGRGADDPRGVTGAHRHCRTDRRDPGRLTSALI